MKTHDTTIENQTPAFVLDAKDRHGMRPLAERELEQVAAAGGKGGANGGDVHHRR